MKKLMLYILAAVMLGLSLTFAPLIISAEVKTSTSYLLMPELVSAQSKETEWGYGLTPPKNLPIGLGFFAISFVIALAVYLWVRRKMPHDEVWARFPPF